MCDIEHSYATWCPAVDSDELYCLQDTTVGVFKGACLACIASLAVLLYICWNNYPELITHCIFALTLSIFLYGIMYW